MPWIAAIVAAGAQYMGQRKAAKDSNKAMASMANADWGKDNPWLAAAMGKQGNYNVNRNSGFYQDLNKMVNGQDISPWLLNNPMAQLNQGSASNLSKMQGIIGKSNAEGGLANSYALANIGGLNSAKANLMQNYGQYRENQRRNDFSNIMGWMGNAQDRAAGRSTQMMNSYQQPMNGASAFGNLVQGGLAAYGAMGNKFFTGKDNGGSTVQTGANPQYSPYVNSLGSSGNWYQGGGSGGTNPNSSGWYDASKVRWP